MFSEVKPAGKTIIRSGILGIAALMSVCAPVTRLQAQAVGGGQIQGTVVDTNGAVVAGAQVEASQTESGLKRAVTSGGDGGYNLPNLPVGPYQLRVTREGFDAYVQSGIVIQVGNNLRIDVKLQVGGVTQTVQVNAEASMVQTEDQSVSQVIDQQRMVDIPLNGRQARPLGRGRRSSSGSDRRCGGRNAGARRSASSRTRAPRRAPA